MGQSTRPVCFACETSMTAEPAAIAARILDTANWVDFPGYGPLPGIEAAEFEVRTDEVLGSRVRVRNRDGSTHLEEITEWDPARRVVLVMQEFSPPLSKLARGIEETWDFERTGETTRVMRSFAIWPKSAWTRPAVWLIAKLLKRAIARHLEIMRRSETV